jgi:hypothetical protein
MRVRPRGPRSSAVALADLAADVAGLVYLIRGSVRYRAVVV